MTSQKALSGGAPKIHRGFFQERIHPGQPRLHGDEDEGKTERRVRDDEGRR